MDVPKDSITQLELPSRRIGLETEPYRRASLRHIPMKIKVVHCSELTVSKGKAL